jgi:hypothetical protein
MHDRSKWERGHSGPQTINGKGYKNLTEFKRPCVACGELFSIFVTSKIAAGHADSNSFGLVNCEAHRKNKSNGEVDQLRGMVATMKEEIDPLYARNRELFAEVQVLKARLATYELQGAMASVAQNKMPWE